MSTTITNQKKSCQHRAESTFCCPILSSTRSIRNDIVQLRPVFALLAPQLRRSITSGASTSLTTMCRATAADLGSDQRPQPHSIGDLSFCTLPRPVIGQLAALLPIILLMFQKLQSRERSCPKRPWACGVGWDSALSKLSAVAKHPFLFRSCFSVRVRCGFANTHRLGASCVWRRRKKAGSSISRLHTGSIQML
jgi:hypothetical protein